MDTASRSSSGGFAAALLFLLPVPMFILFAWFTRTLPDADTGALIASPFFWLTVVALLTAVLIPVRRTLLWFETVGQSDVPTEDIQKQLVTFPKLVLAGGMAFGVSLGLIAAFTVPGAGARWGDLLAVAYSNAIFFAMPPYILFLQAFERRHRTVPFSPKHLSMSLPLRVNLVSTFVLTSMLTSLLVAFKNLWGSAVEGGDPWGSVLAVGLPIGLLGLGVGILNLFLLMRGIVQRISLCKDFVSTLAEGNVALPALELTSRDELGVLAYRLNHVRDNLGGLLGSTKASVGRSVSVKDELMGICQDTSEEITRIGTQVALADGRAQQILEGTGRVLDRVQRFHGLSAELNQEVSVQSRMVQETSSSLAQMTGAIEDVARLSTSRVQAAKELEAQTTEGRGQMGKTLEQLDQISGSVEDIRSITSVIQGIAAKTNLLAMNAAIEAAHAGSAGAGFAVVADEIRNLAQTSSKNSREIAEKVKAIVQKIGTTVDSGKKTAETFGSLNSELGSFLQFFREIETAMGEMRAGGSSILTASKELQSVSAEVGDRARALDGEADGLSRDMEDLGSQARDTRKAMAEVGTSVAAVTGASAQLKDHTVQLDQSTREVSEMVDNFRT